MSSDIQVVMLALLGVVIGGILTFLTQYFLYRQQEKSEIRKKAIDLKNEQCLSLWKTLSNVYAYLYFSGNYSVDKIDFDGIGEHIKKMNLAIIKAEPFIRHEGFLVLMEVRDVINEFFTKREFIVSHLRKENLSSEVELRFYKDHMAFIEKLEEPMNRARDVLRGELQLTGLGIFGMGDFAF